MPFTYSTPSSIIVELDGRSGGIGAEGYLRGHGSPDFDVYASRIVKWGDGSTITADEKVEILQDLRRAAKAKGWSIGIA